MVPSLFPCEGFNLSEVFSIFGCGSGKDLGGRTAPKSRARANSHENTQYLPLFSTRVKFQLRIFEDSDTRVDKTL